MKKNIATVSNGDDCDDIGTGLTLGTAVTVVIGLIVGCVIFYVLFSLLVKYIKG